MATDHFQHPITKKLQSFALTFPDVTEGASCVNRAFKAKKKNFVFIGEKATAVKVMLKLSPSLEEASAMAAKDPSGYAVGKSGWVTVRFDAKTPPPLKTMEAWIAESYSVLAK